MAGVSRGNALPGVANNPSGSYPVGICRGKRFQIAADCTRPQVGPPGQQVTLAERHIELQEFTPAAGVLERCKIIPAMGHGIKPVVLTVEPDRWLRKSREASGGNRRNPQFCGGFSFGYLRRDAFANRVSGNSCAIVPLSPPSRKQFRLIFNAKRKVKLTFPL
jgi:hypothetical protein